MISPIQTKSGKITATSNDELSHINIYHLDIWIVYLQYILQLFWFFLMIMFFLISFLKSILHGHTKLFSIIYLLRGLEARSLWWQQSTSWFINAKIALHCTYSILKFTVWREFLNEFRVRNPCFKFCNIIWQSTSCHYRSTAKITFKIVPWMFFKKASFASAAAIFVYKVVCDTCRY